MAFYDNILEGGMSDVDDEFQMSGTLHVILFCEPPRIASTIMPSLSYKKKR